MGRRAELDVLERSLAASAHEPQVVMLSGDAGVGKTTLLRLFAWGAEERGNRVTWISGEDVASSPETITSTLARSASFPDPWASLGHGDVSDVIVVDAAENIWRTLGWLFGEVLSRSGSRLLIVVATRSSVPVHLRARMSFASPVVKVRLAPFSRDELAAAMTARGLPLARISEVEAASGGSPLAFALVAEHFAQTGALPTARSADDPWVVLSREFLRSATTAVQAEALRALSVPRVVDADLLAAMLGIPDALPLYRFLGELSFVDETPRGLTLHGVVRRSVFAELRSDQAKLFTLYATRAIERLAARAAESPLATSYELILETLFISREERLSQSFLFFEDMRRHGVRLARDEELDVIRRCVERFEGKSSLATFDALAKVQRDRIFVVTGEHDEAESVCFPVAIDAVPSALIERDPILRACRERVAATDVVVNRFWFTFEGYQDFGPRMTALMFAGPPLQMSLPPCRFVVFAVADPDRWLPLNAAFGLTHVEGPPPNDPRIVLAVADLDKIAPSGGSREDRARILFLFHARNFAEMSSRAPTARPSRDVFFDGVRDALPLLRRPLELGQSILLQSAIIAATTDPVVALVQVFHDALDELGRAEGYREDAEVLRGSYFGPSAKQEAVAAGLKLPFGTFRHRLRRATTRLTELLWQRELATRSGDS